MRQTAQSVFQNRDVASMTSDELFNAPGAVKVSAAALKLASDLDYTVKRRSSDWVVSFDWAQSISVKSSKDGPSENIGACLMLGAYRRNQIPRGFTEIIDGVEFAVKIPTEILDQSVERLIDIDESFLF